MEFVRGVFLSSTLLVGVNGFLAQTNPPSSQSGTISTSKLQEGLIDILSIVTEEKNLRHQLEQEFLKMKQEMAELKQYNTTKLVAGLMSMNTSLNQLKQENQALKQDNLDMKQVTATLQLDNKNLTQKVVNLLFENQAIRHDDQDLKQEIANLKQQNVTFQLDIQHQTHAINDLRSKEDSCRRDLDSLMSNFTGYLGDRQHQEIGFTVKFTNNININGIMKFNSVISRYGNEYNTTTGIFTCKTSGLYMFNLSIFSPSPDAQAKTMKNNNTLAWAYVSSGHNDNAYDSASTSVVVYLDVDDKVWAQSTGTVMFESRSYFTGALLSV